MSLQSYAEVTRRTARPRARGADAPRPPRRRSPRFDSGYWTYYALPGDWSPLDYQQYVVASAEAPCALDARFASPRPGSRRTRSSRRRSRLTTPASARCASGSRSPRPCTATTAAGTGEALSLSGGWHSLGLAGAEARGLLRCSRRRGRLGRQPRRVRHAADRARCRDGSSAESRPSHGSRTRCRARRRSPSVRASPIPGRLRLRSPQALRLVRFGVSWPAGAVAPDPGLVAALQRVPARLGIVVDLYAAPVDDAGRAALAQYGASLVQQVPSIRDVLLAPAPTVAAAPSYAATLAALRNAVVPTGIPVAVGPLIDGAQTPKAVLAAIGQALAATGVVADVVGFKPAPAVGKNLWTTANVPQVTAAVAQALRERPTVLVDGVVATPTAAADLISGAACSTTLQGIVLEQLTADARLTAAVAAAQRGTVVCPGPRGRRRRDDAHLPRDARPACVSAGRARLLTRLSVSRHAGARRRDAGRGEARCPARRRRRRDRHAAADHARRPGRTRSTYGSWPRSTRAL